MNDLITTDYFITTEVFKDGQHFVHTGKCQVLPETGTTKLGTYEDCGSAMDEARKNFDSVNACALCCSECYIGSDEFEALNADN